MSDHTQEFSVEQMRRVLGVSRSGYYAWRRRTPSCRAQANALLVERIREAHQASRRTYGSPRIHATLKRQGVVCGRQRVARLMRCEGIIGKTARRRRPVTTQVDAANPVAPNQLAQNFKAEQVNRKWSADITYVDTTDGWLYLASVLDLCSRKVIGWSMADHLETSLVEDAFHMAFAARCPDDRLLHHSDRGSQYTSLAYQKLMTKAHCQVSMSRTGNCYDNAMMESFFATLKAECVTAPFESHAQARTAIFEYIEVWYNRQRLHSSLGYLSPEEFEKHLALDTHSVH
jgi:putative transposase